MNDPAKTIESIAREMSNVGAMLIEGQIHRALRIAGVTTEDLNNGIARVIRVVDNHSDCASSGVWSRWSPGNKIVTVELCSCLEIRVAKRIVAPTP